MSAEGFKGHGCGAIIGGGSVQSPSILNIDIHHNVFAHNQNRNPLFKGKSARVINNIVYDWDWWPSGWEGGATIDIIGNSYKKGPASGTEREIYYRPNTEYRIVGNPSVYIAGNKGPTNTNPDSDNWNMIDQANDWVTTKTAPSTSSRRTSPMSAPVYPITVHSSKVLDSILLNEAGASKRLDQNGNWIVNRDAVDKRVVQEYQNGTGVIPVNESDVGGFPVLATGTAYADADHDGMPDAWEQTYSFNSNSASDQNLDTDNDGFTNVEEFLNGTNPRSGDVNVAEQNVQPLRNALVRPALEINPGVSGIVIVSEGHMEHSVDGKLLVKKS